MDSTDGNWDYVFNHLSTRLLFSEDLISPFLCSVGAHIANLKQKEDEGGPFFFVGRQPDDLRVNVTVVAPSGFSKSHTMKCFIGKFGVLPYDVFKCSFRGKLTEAGFIGTITGEGDVIYGDAYDFSEGFLAFNEITNIFLAGNQEHSAEMVNQVMEALSEGRVSKRLARGLIDYPTSVTIWGGVQFRRYDFSQGLARRFLFVSRGWKAEDVDRLKDSRFKVEDRNIEDLQREVLESRERIRHIYENFRIKEIAFSDKTVKHIKEIASTHLDTSLFQKCLIGREIWEKHTDSFVEIKMTKENKKLLHTFRDMLSRVAEGSDLAALKIELEQFGGEATRNQLWQVFRKYSYTLDTFTALIERGMKNQIIEARMVRKKGRWVKMLCLTDIGKVK